MSAAVVAISAHPRYRLEREPSLGKAQIAACFNVSTRWIELRHHDGLPSFVDERGHRRYVPSEVEKWMEERSGAA